MAVDGISSTRTAGVTVSHTGDSTKRASGSTSDSRSRSAGTKTASVSQHIIDFEGRSFDRYAPRGTYLNIVA